MRKQMLSKIIALTVLTTTCTSGAVFASGEELHNNINTPDKIETRLTHYDVIRSYSKYQGKSVQVNEIRKQSNGDTYYYTGTVNYIGRDGLFGDYQYLGDLRKFTLYKIVTKDGSVITPMSIE
ncbi:MAG: hypothetical protein KH415_22230 [Clostridium sp.]|nr:hypothetical protein [Clostridium sp.]